MQLIPRRRALVSDWDGINQTAGTANLVNSTFTQNRGPLAGAIANIDAGVVNGVASTFDGNAALGTTRPSAGAIDTILAAETYLAYDTMVNNKGASLGPSAGALYNDGKSKAYLGVFAGTLTGNHGFYGAAGDDGNDSDVGNTIAAGNLTLDPNAAAGKVNPDLNGLKQDGGNVAGPGVMVDLAPLGKYGGAAPTMIPLPGSSAICAGEPSLIAEIESNYGITFTADQRGAAPTNNTYPGYSSTACVDAGSVQTHYALDFTGNPPATVNVDNPFTAASTAAGVWWRTWPACISPTSIPAASAWTW